MPTEQTSEYLVLGEGRQGIYPQASSHLHLKFAPGMSILLHFWVVSTTPLVTLKQSEATPSGVLVFSGRRSGGRIRKIPGPLPFMEQHCIYWGCAQSCHSLWHQGPGGGLGLQDCRVPEVVLEPGPPEESVSVTAGAKQEVKDTRAGEAKMI